MWATKFDKCVVCGTTEIPHKAKGLCEVCYGRKVNKTLGTKQSFVCATCGKVFVPAWYASTGRKFCSHECSIKYHTGKSRGIKHTKEEVIERMRTEVLSAGKYIPLKDLCKVAHICYNTLVSLGITRVEVYKGIQVGQPTSVEDDAYYILSEYIPDLCINKVFDDCFSPKGKKLRFDLYSKTFNFLMEIDGEHHRLQTKQEYLAYFQQCDALKEHYALSKGITFIRVPVKRNQVVTYDLIMRNMPTELARTISSQAND